MKKDTKLKKLVYFLYELGTLRKVARAHLQMLMTNDLSDNIASHSFRVAMIGWFLAKQEKADAYKVVMMCLFHDVPEARSSDHNWVHKRYVKIFEDEIIEGQLKSLPGEVELKKIVTEYEERKTKESKIAKAADLLDQILLLKEYSQQGNKEAKRWLSGSQQEKKVEELLKSKHATRLAYEITKQSPSDWWQNLWTSERR